MTSVTEDVIAISKRHSDTTMWGGGVIYLTAAVYNDIKVAVLCALYHR
jgi:hypothetical protein